LSPMKIVGDISFPVSMIVLGAWLAKSRVPRGFSEIKPLLNIAIVKLVVVPALFFVAALKLDIVPFLGLFIVIEASMPSAATMPIIADIHNANSEFTSQGVFFTHLVALVTVPVWIELYLKVTGFVL
jgi:predicted permease